jgi:hypothetical protein
VTKAHGSNDDSHTTDKVDATQSWRLPSAPEPVGKSGEMGDATAPLTEMQRDVVDEVERAQHEVRRGKWWRTAAKWSFRNSAAFSEVAAQADNVATAYEHQAESLVEPKVIPPPPHVLSGGPATPAETYEAEMHPWPHHGMAETIERNRGLRNGESDPTPPGGPTDTPADS